MWLNVTSSLSIHACEQVQVISFAVLRGNVIRLVSLYIIYVTEFRKRDHFG